MTDGSRARYIGQLRTQIGFLRRSAALFDAGHTDEALRLATTVRVLVHDTGKATSLLALLAIKKSIHFVDTAVSPEVLALVSTPGLTILRSTAGHPIEYVAPLGDLSPSRVRSAGFEEWWTSVVIRDARGRAFSRKDLVLAVADQDGGAHVDATLDPDYEALSRANAVGFIWRSPGGDLPFPDPVPPSLRQIAYEVISTLDPWLSDLGSEGAE